MGIVPLLGPLGSSFCPGDWSGPRQAPEANPSEGAGSRACGTSVADRTPPMHRAIQAHVGVSGEPAPPPRRQRSRCPGPGAPPTALCRPRPLAPAPACTLCVTEPSVFVSDSETRIIKTSPGEAGSHPKGPQAPPPGSVSSLHTLQPVTPLRPPLPGAGAGTELVLGRSFYQQWEKRGVGPRPYGDSTLCSALLQT